MDASRLITHDASQRLNDDTLASIDSVATPLYDRSHLTIGIAHFGVGNFHRTHQAVYIDRLLAIPGNEQWAILGIGISDSEASQQKARAFADQDGLFTVTEFEPSGEVHARVIGSIRRYLHAPADPEAVVSALSAPGLRIVTLTITEGGYFVEPTQGGFDSSAEQIQFDSTHNEPKTVFGFIVRALARRRALGTEPFTVVSCDNLPGNGDVARQTVVGLANMIDPELATWIDDEVAFPNSMVDRVAPYMSAADRAAANALTGIDDLMPVSTEDYLQWVLEDKFSAGRPDLAAVGVQLTHDVRPYETVKLRLLNASHVLLSYPSILIGHRIVNAAMADTDIRSLVATFMTDDAMPLLEGSVDIDLGKYRDMVISRFGNPAINDQLLRIATDGASKIPTFHRPTILHQRTSGTDVRREAFLVACYQKYLAGVDDEGQPFEVTEPSLDPEERSLAATGDGVLQVGPFAELNLADDPRFVAVFHEMQTSLAQLGTAATIRDFVVSVPKEEHHA